MVSRNSTESIIEEFLYVWQKQFAEGIKNPALFFTHMQDSFVLMQKIFEDSAQYVNNNDREKRNKYYAQPSCASDISVHVNDQVVRLHRRIARLERRIRFLEKRSRQKP